MGKELDPGNLARGVLKVMHLTRIAILDDFLPFSREQLPKIARDRLVSDGVFEGTTLGRNPAGGHGTGGIHITIKVEWHAALRRA
jgi:hypothetical protein